MERRSESPCSDILSDKIDPPNPSINASLLKRSLSKHHNNNIKAGYVPVHEQHLESAGLKGRKTFAFWTLLFLLLILAAGNLIMTIIILSVLRLGQGMENLQLLPLEQALKFMGDTDFGNVYKRDGVIDGFLDVPVKIVGENGAIFVNLAVKYGRPVNKLKIDSNETIFRNVDDIEIKNKRNDVVFSTSFEDFKQFKPMNSLNTKLVECNRVTSPIGQKITIGANKLDISGAEGTVVDGQTLHLYADRNIQLSSNNSIHLRSKNGIYLDTRKMPTVVLKPTNYNKTTYKVCICMPQGKLFKMSIPDVNSRVHCNQVNYNPCM